MDGGRRRARNHDLKPPGKRRCGAKTRAGTPCVKWPVTGRTRCRNHGGASRGGGPPKGSANALKHGAYSPRVLTFAELVDDEQEAALNEEMAALRTNDLVNEIVWYRQTLAKIRRAATVGPTKMDLAAYVNLGATLVRGTVQAVAELRALNPAGDAEIDSDTFTWVDAPPLLPAGHAGVPHAGQPGPQDRAPDSAPVAVEDLAHGPSPGSEPDPAPEAGGGT